MKKIGLIIVISSNLLFSSTTFTNTSSFLSDTFENKFICVDNKCEVKNFIIKDKKDKSETIIGDIIINLNKNFKDIKYDSKTIKDNIFLTCNNDKTLLNDIDRKKCKEQSLLIKQSSILAKILSQANSIYLKNITLKDVNKTKYIDNIKLSYSKNLFKLRNLDLSKISINDLIFDFHVKVSGLSYDDSDKNLLNFIVSLFSSSSGSPVMKELNSSLKEMYSKLIPRFNKKYKFKGNLYLDVSSSIKDKNNIIFSAKYKYSSSNFANTTFEVNTLLVDFVPLLKNLSTVNMDNVTLSTLFQNLQLFGQNIIFKNIYSSFNLSKLNSVHLELLKKDADYKKSYEKVINILNNNQKELKEKLSNYAINIYAYSVLSMQKKTTELNIYNQFNYSLTELVMSVLSGKSFEDLVKIETLF